MHKVAHTSLIMCVASDTGNWTIVSTQSHRTAFHLTCLTSRFQIFSSTKQTLRSLVSKMITHTQIKFDYNLLLFGS